MQLKGRWSSYCMKYENYCCTCTIAIICSLDVLFTNTCVLYKSVKSFSERQVCVVDITRACSRALTISTLVLSVKVLEGSLRRGEDGYYNSLISQPLHYRIASPLDQSLPSSSLCVFTGSALVQPNAPTLLLAKHGAEVLNWTGLRRRETPPSWPVNRRPWWSLGA